MRSVIAAAVLAVSQCVPEDDLVSQIPGFPPAPFRVFSGYLNVPGPLGPNGAYDSLTIHYQFHECISSPASAPVVTWHQGGPGGSSIYGLYGEMGYFTVAENGTSVNHFSWNRVANMLYLESPAGSNNPIGFSSCTTKGKLAAVCSWDDVTQAEAYAHTLLAFFKAFPEYAPNDLYLSGESYAGQYLPNIASYILDRMPSAFAFKGILVGNGCWGGTNTSVACNGPNSEQNDVDMYFGKGLISKPMYDDVYRTCAFPLKGLPGPACAVKLEEASLQVGPHNIYDIFDNCPQTTAWLQRAGKSMRWLKNYLRAQLDNGTAATAGNAAGQLLLQMGGGYDWQCGGLTTLASFLSRTDVRGALHLGEPNPCRFEYKTSGPASITLYPQLVGKIRILIYNGDADACVPYKGNEEWTEGLAAQGVIKQNKAWHPWFDEAAAARVPAGYVTTYSVDGSPLDFSFLTIRLAGHMVPQFQPAAALAFFTKFLSHTPL